MHFIVKNSGENSPAIYICGVVEQTLITNKNFVEAILKKAVIIGAGPAGLTAANELLKNKDFEVVVLEEAETIGGISKTVEHNGNRMDIGGHRFFSKDERVLNYWKEFMPIQGKPSYDDKRLERIKNLPSSGPDPEVDDIVMLIRNRVSRIYYLKKFFDYPISMKKETFFNMGLKRVVKAGCSYIKSVFIKRKENSLEDFYINRFGKVLYSMFFERYTEKLWGRHPNQISPNWGAQRVKGLFLCTILRNALFKRKKRNVETSLIEKFWYPKYGPGQFWEVVVANVANRGGKILKNHKVSQINIENNKVVSVTCDLNHESIEIKGDIFLSSMPLKDLICGMKHIDVPNDILKIAKGLPYLDFQTVGVLVKKLKIKNETGLKTLSDIVPDCWVYVQEPDVKMLRFQVFNNWSPYMVKNPEETVWIGLEYTCLENDKYWNMGDEEFCDFAVNELAKIGIIEKTDVMDTHRVKVKKAYPAYFDTYDRIDEVIKFLNCFDNLYCIGRNGQHRYNNMDHSMLTGIAAATNIINGVQEKYNVWNINTEQVYHEEKS